MPGSENADRSAVESVLVPIDRLTLVRTANLVITLMVALLSLLKWFILGSEFLPLAGILIALLGVCNGIYLAMGGSALVVARLIIVGLTLALVYASFITGGFGGPIVLFAPVLPVLSFLLIGPRAGWIAAIGMVVGLLVILQLHFVNAVPPTPHAQSTLVFGRFIAVASTGIISTWVIWAFAVTATALGERNELLANTDHLTGIANRRFSENYLNQEVHRARRSGRDLSLIVGDVDSFKRYNDVNGHQAGDECLKKVALVMELCTQRPGDMVGRFGGEEFIAVLPETGADGALIVAERMRQAVLDEYMPYDPNEPEVVSMTFGVSSFRGKEIESASSMIKLADRALYLGKEQGRNTVMMNQPLRVVPG